MRGGWRFGHAQPMDSCNPRVPAPGPPRRSRWIARTFAGSGVLLSAVVAAVPAQATFPGGNGRIAYTWSRGGEGNETPPHPRLLGVVSVRPDGGDWRLLARGGTSPHYSPDGHRIAFLRSNRLWVARADGEQARPLTPGEWRVGDHQWSPRGTRLALVRSSRNGTWHALYSVRPDGTGLQRLLKAPTGIGLSSGAWSPNGKAIVYAQHRQSGRALVRVIRARKTTTLALGSQPSWSRRGLIAYASGATRRGTGEVCVMRPRSGSLVHCFGFADAAVTDPSWAPDGRRLMLLYTPKAGPAEIWTARPDGAVLTRAPRDSEFPIFSPDGRWLAFSADRFGGDPRLGYSDLHLKRPDGTGDRRLVRGGQARSPDWQPLTRRRASSLTKGPA